MHERQSRPRLRLWPAVLIILLGAAAASWFWFGGDLPQQERNLRTFISIFSASILLLLWFLVFSRARWRIRALTLGGVVLAVLLAKELFVITDVSGDLVPRVDLKWRSKRQLEPPAPAGRSASLDSPTGKAAEFSGFLGSLRNGVVQTASLDTNWAANPPKVLWKRQLGAAWSGFAVKDGFAVTQEQRETLEYVVCYELLTGNTLWAHSDNAIYSTTIAGEGPRATPTISSNRVYTFGATGLLNALDLTTGKLLWSKNTVEENHARVQEWGMASSPLVADGMVVVSVGGDNGRSLVAYNADDGSIRWADGSGRADYSSPLLAEFFGERQILIFNSAGLVSHQLDGRILWQYPWPGGHPHITVPVVVSTDQVLVSSGYGTGTELLRVHRDPQGKWSAERVWKSMALKSKFAPMFVHEEYIYGLDDGIFTCVELKTGQRKWKDGRYGHGQALMAGGLILLTAEKGDLILIEPNPSKLVEIARYSVFPEKTWNPPALVGEYLLMRNHMQAACLQLQATAQPQNMAALLFAKHVFAQ